MAIDVKTFNIMQSKLAVVDDGQVKGKVDAGDHAYRMRSDGKGGKEVEHVGWESPKYQQLREAAEKETPLREGFLKHEYGVKIGEPLSRSRCAVEEHGVYDMSGRFLGDIKPKASCGLSQFTPATLSAAVAELTGQENSWTRPRVAVHVQPDALAAIKRHGWYYGSVTTGLVSPLGKVVLLVGQSDDRNRLVHIELHENNHTLKLWFVEADGGEGAVYLNLETEKFES